jgi:hypothetical protein
VAVFQGEGTALGEERYEGSQGVAVERVGSEGEKFGGSAFREGETEEEERRTNGN